MCITGAWLADGRKWSPYLKKPRTVKKLVVSWAWLPVEGADLVPAEEKPAVCTLACLMPRCHTWKSPLLKTPQVYCNVILQEKPAVGVDKAASKSDPGLLCERRIAVHCFKLVAEAVCNESQLLPYALGNEAASKSSLKPSAGEDDSCLCTCNVITAIIRRVLCLMRKSSLHELM